jgi:hypothetical protein
VAYDVPQSYDIDANSAKDVTLEVQHMKSSMLRMILCCIQPNSGWERIVDFVTRKWKGFD